MTDKKPSRKEQILQSLAHMLEAAPGGRITTAGLAKEVGVSLVDEALTPSTVSQRAVSLGNALKVEGRAERQQTSFMFHISHDRWLCQIPTCQANRITIVPTP